MTTYIDVTCHACGVDYRAEEEEACDFDLCYTCREAKRIFAIIIGGNPEDTLYAAGPGHLAERILEDVYPEHGEFSDDEWNGMPADLRAFGKVLADIQDHPKEDMPTEDLQAFVAQYVKGMSAFWTHGVEHGILATNVQHHPGGPIFREWPMPFQIAVYERRLTDLIENGVCSAVRR
jgi:hypothetical protein